MLIILLKIITCLFLACVSFVFVTDLLGMGRHVGAVRVRFLGIAALIGCTALASTLVTGIPS